MTNLSAAIGELEKQRAGIAAELRRIESAVNALRSAGRATVPRSARRIGTQRVMSAAARRRIAAAQKARWAKWRKANKAR